MTKRLTEVQKLATTMNGASNRLRDIREDMEQGSENLGLAVMDLKITERAIQRIDFVREQIEQLVQDLRSAETLALPPNWRLMMSIDLPGAIVFLNEIDQNILGLALGRCEPCVLDFLRARLGASGSVGAPEQIAIPDKETHEAIPQQD